MADTHHERPLLEGFERVFGVGRDIDDCARVENLLVALDLDPTAALYDVDCMRVVVGVTRKGYPGLQFYEFGCSGHPWQRQANLAADARCGIAGLVQMRLPEIIRETTEAAASKRFRRLEQFAFSHPCI
jgi:hypothetical protein